MCRMSCSAKDISQIVFTGFVDVFCLWNSVIILAVDTFRASTSCKVNTEVSWTFFLKVICFCESSVYLWLYFGEWWCTLNLNVSVSQVFIIPDIVIVVTLLVCSISLALVYLFSGSPLHPLVYLQVFILPKILKLFCCLFTRIFIRLIFVFCIPLCRLYAGNLIELLSLIVLWVKIFERIPLLLIKFWHFSLVLSDALLHLSFFLFLYLR